MDEYLGKRIDGRYEITEIIGVGGMANVYKANDLLEKRVVAVKIMHDDHMQNEDMRRRFKNESKAMAVLDHPNIRRIYDVCFTSKIHCIVMEYVDGITLKDYLEQKGALGWKEALDFIVQILYALRHAHERGIVHRDVKPENMLLLADGSLKLTDFGIARFARSEIRTLTQMAIGSVHYISPEQAAGASTDARTDLYAMGVLLYQMLTGRVPFEANTPISVALQQIENQARPPRELNPDIPEGLEEITMHAMEKDMNKRYQSAAAMLRDIEEFKQNPSISFAYHYLDEGHGGDKYAEVIEEVRAKREKGHARRHGKKRKKLPAITVIAMVTLAVLAATAILITVLFNSMNAVDIIEKTPNLLGMNYEQVRENEEYNEFEIVREDYAYIEDGERIGQILSQEPPPGDPLPPGIAGKRVIRVVVAYGSSDTKVPDFRGQQAQEAHHWASDNASAAREELLYDDEIPAGCIVSTKPAAGEELPLHEELVVYVSQGPAGKPIKLPDFKGISLADVERMAGYYGIRIGRVTYDADYPDETYRGLVVDQSPEAGVLVEPGGTVNLTVAGEGSDLMTLQIMAPLPKNITHFVRLSAVMGGREVAYANTIPAQMKTWRPDFYALRGTQAEVNIFIDGRLYQVYALDFGEREVTRLHDYSDDFE